MTTSAEHRTTAVETSGYSSAVSLRGPETHGLAGVPAKPFSTDNVRGSFERLPGSAHDHAVDS